MKTGLAARLTAKHMITIYGWSTGGRLLLPAAGSGWLLSGGRGMKRRSLPVCWWRWRSSTIRMLTCGWLSPARASASATRPESAWVSAASAAIASTLMPWGVWRT